jgi:hypothetical protein
VRLGFLLVMLAAALWMYWYVGNRLVSVFVTRLPSGLIFLMEDSRHPALQRFRKQEGIDRVAALPGDELVRLQALAKWTSQLFPATSPFPDYPPFEAAELLRQIRAGETGGFCAQYAFVFGQSCLSLGYQVRYCDLASADRENSHLVPEVYLPSLRKWVVFEPQFGYSYTDERGTPLGVLDLHEIQVGLRAGRVLAAPGGDLVLSASSGLFRHYRYYQRNNFLSVPSLYTVRVVSGGLQWMFEHYRPVCTARDTGGETGGRAEFDFIPEVGEARRTMAFSADSFLAAACGEELGRVIRIKAPARVLDEVVKRMLSRDLEYHPLDRDTSWWPVPRSSFPPAGTKGTADPSAAGQ